MYLHSTKRAAQRLTMCVNHCSPPHTPHATRTRVICGRGALTHNDTPQWAPTLHRRPPAPTSPYMPKLAHALLWPVRMLYSAGVQVAGDDWNQNEDWHALASKFGLNM